LKSGLPSKQLKMLQGWIAMREDELKENWKLLLEGEPFEPLEDFKLLVTFS